MKKLFLMLVCCTMVATANAQLGGLMKKATKAARETKQNVDNAATKVDNQQAKVANSDAVQSAKEADAQYNSPQAVEDRAVAAAGGMQKYLGLTDAEGQVFWKYFKMGLDLDKDNQERIAQGKSKKPGYTGGIGDAVSSSFILGNVMRLMKGNTDAIGKYKLWYTVNHGIEGNFKAASRDTPDPIPVKERDILLKIFYKVRDQYNVWREQQDDWRDE